MTHALQATFASLEGEAEWSDKLQALIENGELDAAEAILAEAVEALDTDMGRLCLAATRESVVISGWDELIERIEMHEGDPVTGMTLAIGNEADLAFEKGQLHAPYVTAAIYTDEEWDWSGASRELLLAECASEDPAWAGTDEDVEIYLEIEGLDALNTALIHAKQRYFIREGEPAEAPMRYVDFVVGYWWRALRYHQAVADTLAAEPLPGDVAVLAGMVNMRPEVASVHALGAGGVTVRDFIDASDCIAAKGEPEVDEATEASVLTLVQRKTVVEEVVQPSGTDLRRRFAVAEPEPKRGFIARMLRRA